MMSAKDRLRNGATRLRTITIAATIAALAACAGAPQSTPRTPHPAAASKAPSTPHPEAKPAPTRPYPNFPPASAQLLEARQIALLLPLTGKLGGFGTAVRDGFMAALYEARTQGGTTPAVRIYDTGATTNFIELYQRAVAEGAQAVVGPLEKPQVAALYSAQPNGQTSSVPTLALNHANVAAAPPLNLYQFGLAPEDEATSIARIGIQQNFRHALIIAPTEEQGSPELQSFSNNWRQQGGDIVATALFSNPQGLSQAIKTALNIPQSEMRKREIESLFGRKIEFAPHRRGDVDMIFMLARPQQARSIVPTLAFHYAGNVPTYALSRSYSGISAPELDGDIEGLLFTEMPWMLDAQQPLKQQILASVPGSQNYLRLYALGVDSFYLLPRLRQLESQPDVRIDGQTGYLTLSPQRIVQRELPLAQIKGGVARSATTTATNTLPASLDNSPGINGNDNNGTESPHDSTIDTP